MTTPEVVNVVRVVVRRGPELRALSFHPDTVAAQAEADKHKADPALEIVIEQGHLDGFNFVPQP